MTEKSTCSSGAQVASHFLQQDLGKALKILEETSRLSLRGLLIELARRELCLKMCPVFYGTIQENHSLHSFQFSADGKWKCLFSEKEKTAVPSGDGKIQESLLQAPEDMESHGEYLTLSLCEWNQDFPGPFRKDEGVCSLSHILETGAIPRKYYLSRDASLGILRRAAKRGKELPADLKSALLVVVNQT